MDTMQMGPKEIAVEYRTAANKQKQIKVLAELNQCAERRIAEILDAEGEELPKKWQEQLLKPARRSWKFPDGEASRATSIACREEDPSTPAAPPLRMTGEAETVTDRDIFEAVASVLPDGSREKAAAEAVPTATPEKTGTVTLDPTVWDRGALERKIEPGEISAEVCEASLITREDVCLGACENLLAALDLKPDEFHCYACGTLDLVFSLIGVPKVWQPIHDREV